jgi:hypothetical protein
MRWADLRVAVAAWMTLAGSLGRDSARWEAISMLWSGPRRSWPSTATSMSLSRSMWLS